MSQREKIRLTDAEVRDFLEHSRTMIIVSNGHDGVPHPMPMFYAVEDDGAIVMTTYTKSQKIQNLMRDPRVSLLVEDGEAYSELRGVVLYGTAELIDSTDTVMQFLATIAAQRGEGADESEAALAGRYRMASKRTGIRVRPERVVSWDHRKLVGAQ
ncbi:MAG: TIGR03618 family F420-dependent PPOX class oxidoreductase [Dehalococcoidia bacterium]